MSMMTQARRHTHDGLARGDHHFHGDADGGVHAVEHHAETVADQQEIAMRIKQARHSASCKRSATRRTIALQRDDVGGREAFLRGGVLMSGGLPASGGGVADDAVVEQLRLADADVEKDEEGPSRVESASAYPGDALPRLPASPAVRRR